MSSMPLTPSHTPSHPTNHASVRRIRRSRRSSTPDRLMEWTWTAVMIVVGGMVALMAWHNVDVPAIDTHQLALDLASTLR